jgi:hypothetical protein
VGKCREDSLIPQIWDQPLTDERKKKELQFELDDYTIGLENMDSVINSIGSAAIIMSAASKGKEGWLGNLIISSKKLAEIITSPIQGVKKGILGH